MKFNTETYGKSTNHEDKRILHIISQTPIALFHKYLSPSGVQPEQLYSNMSQILLLYKTWGYYNKFESMKSLGVCYQYIKMPRCGCVEHGLRYNTLYVWNHRVPLAVCSAPLVRDGPLGVPEFLWLVFLSRFNMSTSKTPHMGTVSI